MIVAIAGASGLTGSLCLQMLLQNPEITKVIAIGRSPLQIIHPKLQQVMLHLGKLQEPVVADAFISCLGTTIKKAGSKTNFEAVDRVLPVHLAESLHQHGCGTAAVVSAMGANADSIFFYNKVKGKMESDFKQIGFASLHILRPSLIEGNRQENRPMEKFAQSVFRFINPLLRDRLKHYRSVPAATIARALVQCVTRPSTGQFTYLSATIEKVAEQ